MNQENLKKALNIIDQLFVLKQTDPHSEQYPALLHAIKKYLLKASRDDLGYQEKFKTALLHELIHRLFNDLIDYLLEHRSDLNITSIPISGSGATFLQKCIQRADLFAIYWPILKKHDISLDYSELLSAIACVTDEQRVLEVVCYFIEKHPDCDLAQEIYLHSVKQRVTGAILAACNGYPQVLKIFLDKGVPLRLSESKTPDVQARYFDSVLESAIRARPLGSIHEEEIDTKKYIPIIDMVFAHLAVLKSRSADPSAPISTSSFYKEGFTPLHSGSIQNNATLFLRVLLASLRALKEGVITYDLNTSNIYGQNALHIALEEEMDEGIIASLIKQGASVFQRDCEGRHAFFLLQRSPQVGRSNRIAKMLFDAAKNNLSEEDFQNWLNQPVRVHALLQTDVSFYHQTSGATVLHQAVLLQSEELIQLCIEAGSDLTIQNGLGLTPFDYSFIYSSVSNKIRSLLYEAMKAKGLPIYHRIAQEKTVLHKIDLMVSEKKYDPDYLNGKSLVEMSLEKGYSKEFAFLVANGAIEAELEESNHQSPFLYLLDFAAHRKERFTIYFDEFLASIGQVLSEYPQYHDYLLGAHYRFENKENNAFYQMIVQKEFLLLRHILDCEKNRNFIFEKASLYVLEEYCISLIAKIRSLGISPAQFQSSDGEIIAFHVKFLENWLAHRANHGMELLSNSPMNLLKVTLEKDNRGFEKSVYKNIALLMQKDIQKHSFFHQKENVLDFVIALLALDCDDQIGVLKAISQYGLLDHILKNACDCLDLYTVLSLHNTQVLSKQMKQAKKECLSILAKRIFELGISYEWSLNDSFYKQIDIIKHQMILEIPVSQILMFLPDKKCVLNEQQFLYLQHAIQACDRKKYSQIYRAFKHIYDQNLLELSKKTFPELASDLFHPEKSQIVHFIAQYHLPCTIDSVLALIVLSQEYHDYSLEMSLIIEAYCERFLFSAASELSTVFSGLGFAFREKIQALQNELYEARTKRELIENNTMHAQEGLSSALVFAKPSIFKKHTDNREKVLKEVAEQREKNAMSPEVSIKQPDLTKKDSVVLEQRSSATHANQKPISQDLKINQKKTSMIRQLLKKTDVTENGPGKVHTPTTATKIIVASLIEDPKPVRFTIVPYFPNRYSGPCTEEQIERLIGPSISYESDRAAVIKEKRTLCYSLKTALASWNTIKDSFVPENSEDYAMIKAMQILEGTLCQQDMNFSSGSGASIENHHSSQKSQRRNG